MLSADQLSMMRNCQANLLPDTCLILQVENMDDDAGGWAEIEEDESCAGEGTACRVGLPSNGTDRAIAAQIVGEREGVVMLRVVTLPFNTVIDETCQIEVTVCAGSPEMVGKKLAVKAVLESGSWETARRVMCEEIK